MHRQYTREEVSVILKEAAEESRKRSGQDHDEGLTLAELQAIGAESDIDPAAIQRAAARLDATSLMPQKKRTLGINVGAAHAVRLPGPMTDAEFEALVADCRRIFDARGKVTEQSNYREWRNGNLRVWTEQDPHSGVSLLSMQSTQGLMRAMITGGGFLVVFAAVMALMSIFETGGDAIAVGLTLAFAGLAVIGTGALATRSWSTTREEQMEEIGERALERQAQTVKETSSVAGVTDANTDANSASTADSILEDLDEAGIPDDRQSVRRREQS